MFATTVPGFGCRNAASCFGRSRRASLPLRNLHSARADNFDLPTDSPPVAASLGGIVFAHHPSVGCRCHGFPNSDVPAMKRRRWFVAQPFRHRQLRQRVEQCTRITCSDCRDFFEAASSPSLQASRNFHRRGFLRHWWHRRQGSAVAKSPLDRRHQTAPAGQQLITSTRPAHKIGASIGLTAGSLLGCHVCWRTENRSVFRQRFRIAG